MEAEIIKVQDMKDIEKLYPDEYEVSYLRDVKIRNKFLELFYLIRV